MLTTTIEFGKSYLTKEGNIIHMTDDATYSVWKNAGASIECEYKGMGPDHIQLANWKDPSAPNYMQWAFPIDENYVDDGLGDGMTYCKEDVHLLENDDIIEPNVGKKNDAGKPMFSCLPPDALMELGKVAALGARKYGHNNYRNGITVSRYMDAAFRHLIAAMGGEDEDPIDGNNHLASAAWNMLACVQVIKDHPALDDRYSVTNYD